MFAIYRVMSLEENLLKFTLINTNEYINVNRKQTVFDSNYEIEFRVLFH